MVQAGIVIKALGIEFKRQDPLTMVMAMVALYLVDWKAAVDFGRQISDASWSRSGALPVAKEVLYDIFGDRKSSPHAQSLSEEELEIVYSIREKIHRMNLDQIVRLAGSTYPMIADSVGDKLDLIALAHIYKRDFTRKRDRVPA